VLPVSLNGGLKVKLKSLIILVLSLIFILTFCTPGLALEITNIESAAYDLDRYSGSYNGISEEVWSWREANSASWNEYPISNLGNRSSVLNIFKNDLNAALGSGGNYLVKYEVKDQQGVWSKPNVRLLTNTDQPPVASFSVIPNPVVQNHSVSYENNSYDPNGDDLVEEEWSIEYPGGSIDFPGSPPNSYSNTGNHKIGLRVRDANGNWSEWHYQNLEVILENQRPVADFNISPNPLPADVPLQYQDNSYDPDGHPIVAREWQYQKVGGSWKIGQVTDFSSLGPGDYLIRLKVRDDPPPPLGAKDSSWHTNNLTVVQSNEKPVAKFTVNPNPGIADQPITYNDTSYDPDGAGISERVWRVETQSGTILGEYHNSLPPSIFASTGWGDGGAGDYRIGLKVKDNSPNGISPPLWSDWTWHNLKVVLPLLGTGEITPNPALSGYRVHVTVETKGYAEEVTVKFPSDSFFNGDEITLSPDNPVSNKYNTFRGTYRTDTKTPDGNYNVIATIRRFNLAPETVTENMTMAIQGDIYDQVKVRIRDSR